MGPLFFFDKRLEVFQSSAQKSVATVQLGPVNCSRASKGIKRHRYRKSVSLTQLSDALMIESDDSGLEWCKIDSFGAK